MRPSDRLQSCLHLALVGLLIAMLPLAVLLGVAVHQRVLAESRVGGHPVSATVDADVLPLRYRANALAVPAHWTVDGTEHSALVPVAGKVTKGESIALRVDEQGNPAPPPLNRSEALPDAIFAALLGLAIADVGLVVLWRSACLSLDRHRRAQWEREWALMDLTPRRA
jgi:hypothetical protein